MKYLKHLISSFLLMNLLALCFIDVEANKLTYLVGFAIVFLVPFYTAKNQWTKKERLFLIIFPIIYLIFFKIQQCLSFRFWEYYGFFSIPSFVYVFYKPLFIANFILLILLYFNKFTRTFNGILCGLFVCLFFSNSVYHHFNPNRKHNSSSTIKPIKSQPDSFRLNLDSIELIDSNGNMKNPLKQKKWNFTMIGSKGCAPCKVALKSLFPEISNKFKKIGLHYVLANHKYSKKQFLTKVRKIENSSNTYFDYTGNFGKDLKIKSYPTFILTDSLGNILYHKIGYGLPSKDKILEEISNALDE